jgi:hypothetical protein
MPYPWPTANNPRVLQEALDIALDYLEFTGQSFPMVEKQRTCANVILAAWKSGVTHRIKLANCAIVAIEKGLRPVAVSSFFPKAG